MRFSLSILTFWLLVSGWLLSSGVLSAQSLDKMIRQATNTARITLSKGDSVETFTVANQRRQKQPKDDRFYTWYTANALKHTQGGYAGKLVHEVYLLSNHKKDLLAKGRFRYGLKVGQWQHWYANGQTRATEHWKKGKRHGRYWMYDAEGNVQEKGSYRHDRWHGKRIRFEAGQPMRTEKYRRGKLVENKRKKKNEKLQEKTASTEQSVENTVKSNAQEKHQKSIWKKLKFWKKKPFNEVAESKSNEAEKKQKQAKQKKTESNSKNKEPKAPKKKREPKESVSQ